MHLRIVVWWTEPHGQVGYEAQFARGSINDFSNRSAEIDLQPLAAGDFQLVRIEAEQMQRGGMDVGDVVAVLGGKNPQFVSRAVDDAALDAAAGQPATEAKGMMIAACGALAAWRAAELGAPDDQRLV